MGKASVTGLRSGVPLGCYEPPSLLSLQSLDPWASIRRKSHVSERRRDMAHPEFSGWCAERTSQPWRFAQPRDQCVPALHLRGHYAL